MYHLPLLPGYSPNTNIRSSAPSEPIEGKSFLSRLSEAEEDGYQGSYFDSSRHHSSRNDGYITSSPVMTGIPHLKQSISPPFSSASYGQSETETEVLATASEPEFVPVLSEMELEPERHTDTEVIREPLSLDQSLTLSRNDEAAQLQHQLHKSSRLSEESLAEVVFFEYGVVVFFGLEEQHERDIIEDIERADIPKRRIAESDWEVEEFHYTVGTVEPFLVGPDMLILYSTTHTLPILAYTTTFSVGL